MNYKATIKEAWKELSTREKVIFKDTTLNKKIDENDGTVITVSGWIVLSIHNDAAKPTDYEKYVIIDTSGDRYETGSASFWRQFSDIMGDMQEAFDDGEVIQIKFVKKPSKNYSDKSFLTCALI